MLEGNHLPIILVREGTPHTISLAIRDALFHIGREAITNVLRHARASSITMRLQYEFRFVTMEVCDNGCGFNYERHVQDFGLRGMQTRSSAVGAVLQVVTEPSRGTCVRVKAPYGIERTFMHRIRFIKAGLFRFAK